LCAEPCEETRGDFAEGAVEGDGFGDGVAAALDVAGEAVVGKAEGHGSKSLNIE